MPDDTTPMESGLGRWNAATPDPGRTDSNFGTSRATTPGNWGRGDDSGAGETPRKIRPGYRTGRTPSRPVKRQ